jgi:hypothetical protein
VTWRQAIEGSTGGPIATRWCVEGYPSYVVLDATGAIRSNATLGFPEVETLVSDLLRELEKAPARRWF